MMLTHIAEKINELLPEPHASLLLGMIFGIRTTMPPDFYEALLTTGTIHMIALSGMNISIIIRLLFDSASPLLGKHGSVAVTLLGIALFLYIVGLGPTIVRAAIMGSLTIVASYLGRKSLPLYFLGAAGFIMVCINPAVVGDISFQLSFLATLGIILFGGSASSHVATKHPEFPSNLTIAVITWLWAVVRADLRITLSAQLFTVPVILFNFHRISLISPLANVMVGWLVPFIMYGGLLLVFCSYVFKPLALLLSWVLWVPLTVFITVITWLSRVPIASIEFK